VKLVKPIDQRDLYNGFGDALAKAFELVVTPAIFAFFGWLLDRKVGTQPLFTLLFAGIVFLYTTWRMWFDYDQRMRAEEEKLGIRRAGVKGSDRAG
jgi:hypothetical protein